MSEEENVDFDTVRREYSAAARQVPGKDAAKASTFKDHRKTFTEEQVKQETARCLGSARNPAGSLNPVGIPS